MIRIVIFPRNKASAPNLSVTACIELLMASINGSSAFFSFGRSGKRLMRPTISLLRSGNGFPHGKLNLIFTLNAGGLSVQTVTPKKSGDFKHDSLSRSPTPFRSPLSDGYFRTSSHRPMTPPSRLPLTAAKIVAITVSMSVRMAVFPKRRTSKPRAASTRDLSASRPSASSEKRRPAGAHPQGLLQ